MILIHHKRLLVLTVAIGLSSLPAFHPQASACERCQKWGPFYKETKSAMTQMDAAMTQADGGLVGDPDRDFIALMIPHHQGAIDMARSVLLHGSDPALKNIAQEVIAEQSIEIEYLRKIQARLVAATPSPPVPAAVSQTAPKSDFRFVANEEPTPKKTDGKRSADPVSHAATDRSHDRVYTGDQVSNTVSVIDPGTNELLGLIKLGEVPPAALAPLYKGQSLVHGLGFSPDGTRLCVISIGSNAITLIDTATNKVLKSHYVGRSPHEAFFTPDGKEIYVAVRGEDYVAVLNAETLDEITRVKTNSGPGMILFRPDGKYAYVPSSFTPELCVIDTQTHEVIARVPQASPFSPNLAVSADGKQVWFTLKDSGKTQVMDAAPPFAILGTIATGPITNHVTCVDNAAGHFAYVTVGSLDEVKVYRREPPFEQVATISTGALPHGIWSSPDGALVYIGLENEAKVQAIDTATNKIIASIPIGQLPQALIYVPNAAAHTADSATANLVPLATLKDSKTYQFRPKDETQKARASVTVISLGLIDQVQIAASGLVPGQEYTLDMVDSVSAPRVRELLTKIKASPAGTAIANTLGPVRGIFSGGEAEKAGHPTVALILEPVDAKMAAALVQQ